MNAQLSHSVKEKDFGSISANASTYKLCGDGILESDDYWSKCGLDKGRAISNPAITL